MKKFSTLTTITHVVGWIIFLILPILFLSGQSGRSTLGIVSSLSYWLFFIFWITVFYLHTYYLFPRLYAKGKYLLYSIAMVVLVFCTFWLRPFDQVVTSANRSQAEGPGQFPQRPGDDSRDFRPPPHREGDEFEPRPPFPENGEFREGPGPRMNNTPGKTRFDIVSFFLFGLTIAMSIAIQTTNRWRVVEKKAKQAEADKITAELSFLKAQINPHFLFNTLNNIYSLAVTDSKNTAESILKLSNILRYVTDDAKEDYVLLEHEIACITDYIDLQSLRLGKKTTVDFSFTGEAEERRIAPLILMTFIENAFKYGISNHEKSEITITIDIHNDKIIFICQNKLFKKEREVVSTGIGLNNTKKRLEHLYADRFDFKILLEDGLYKVQLTLFDK